ncbi:hypothetical protein AAFF_G00069380 [Aldrovandia affinis]|uniref:C2H2-type domain-containing protein n=1 Tax=Aldrovandia affinis TaxID=143900 RepID=A0AAD7RZ81_9TELE|nr:hypothetical protein AAFF_G00069380 [Aldrovandia affinis]
MAPVGALVSSWAAAGSLSPEFILTSLLFLFALATLLAVCSQCSKYSFEVKENCEIERSSSVLIRVVNLEGSTWTVENPGANDITKDEQDHSGDLSNHKVNSVTVDAVSEPPAVTFPRIATPFGAALTSPQEEEEITIQSALTEMSRHPPGIPMTTFGRPELWEYIGGDSGPESSADSPADQRRQGIRVPHTYESLEELQDAMFEESPAYQTVAEFNAPATPPPHLSDLQQEVGEDLPTPATADEGPPADGPNAMYAQVSKKCNIHPKPPRAPPDGEEPVPFPTQFQSKRRSLSHLSQTGGSRWRNPSPQLSTSRHIWRKERFQVTAGQIEPFGRGCVESGEALSAPTRRQIMTTPLPRSRLGKRSPMGARVIGPCPAKDGLQEDRSSFGPGFQSQVKMHSVQKVYVNCCDGVMEQHKPVDNEASVYLPQLWTTPTAPPHATPQPRPVSSNIDVPKSCRSPESVDMDEMMAAMVLTSLSCSPVVQSPPQRFPAAAPACGMECGGGELSDSESSGYWSWDRGNGSPAPSPPIAETDSSLAPPPDEGLDMDLEQVLFEEPAPRKRKNSVKVAYRCLWPNCGKVLTSVVGIKRHIRTLHLGYSSEPEQSRREEDFYYTEVLLEMDTAAPPAAPPATPPATPPTTPPAATHSAPPPASWASCASPSGPTQQAAAGPGPRLPEPPVPEARQPGLLSQSAPSCFWQVRSEHSYQACPPVQVLASPVSCPWSPPAAVLSTPQLAPFRSRSVSVGEQWLQQQHSAPTRHHAAGASPPQPLHLQEGQRVTAVFLPRRGRWACPSQSPQITAPLTTSCSVALATYPSLDL